MDNQPYRPTLLDVPISYFEYDHQRDTFANVPSQQTTLRRMATTRFYQVSTEAICAEPDKNIQNLLKKYQPAFTPAALLNHRKKDTSPAEKIQQQWPMMMGDVDQKDNPGVDMAELKKHLARLPFVLICAFSVRRGLWFVVRLPDHQTPETLAAHFRYLQKLFTQKFGIKLDTTKGGNPTDLRFVSYDELPYINENATVLTGTHTPQRKAYVPSYSPKSSFGAPNQNMVLTWLVRRTEAASEGQRHATLLRESKLAGGYISGGLLDEQTVINALETVASEWPNFAKSRKTIRDGIRYGLSAPIYPDATVNYKTTLLSANGLVRGLAPSRVVKLQVKVKSQDEELGHPEQVVQSDTQPKIKSTSFFEWQRTNPAFSQLGLASLQARKPTSNG
ncbi:hypothetical protein [Spirosoma aerophilum]